MRRSRLYSPNPLSVGSTVALSEDSAHYAVRVLRLRTGDPLTLFDGRGGEFEARLAEASARRVVVEVTAHDPVERESPLAVTLGLGVSRGERMDLAVQKAVELGVVRIAPLLTERCVVQLDDRRAAHRVEHWERVAANACEQCGRNRVPDVTPLVPLSAWLAAPPPGRRLVLSPKAEEGPAGLPPPDAGVVLLIGPEGGLSPAEVEVAADAGFTPLRLGPRTLRTETAAVAALAVVQALWGDLAR